MDRQFILHKFYLKEREREKERKKKSKRKIFDKYMGAKGTNQICNRFFFYLSSFPRKKTAPHSTFYLKMILSFFEGQIKKSFLF